MGFKEASNFERIEKRKNITELKNQQGDYLEIDIEYLDFRPLNS